MLGINCEKWQNSTLINFPHLNEHFFLHTTVCDKDNIGMRTRKKVYACINGGFSSKANTLENWILWNTYKYTRRRERERKKEQQKTAPNSCLDIYTHAAFIAHWIPSKCSLNRMWPFSRLFPLSAPLRFPTNRCAFAPHSAHLFIYLQFQPWNSTTIQCDLRHSRHTNIPITFVPIYNIIIMRWCAIRRTIYQLAIGSAVV